MRIHDAGVRWAMAVVVIMLMQGVYESRPAAACGAPLTIDQIQHGIMPTEDNLPCQPSGGGGSGGSYQNSRDQAIREQAAREQAARNRAAREEAARQRAAYEAQCHRNWDRASQALDSGDQTDRDNPREAVQYYERAVSLYETCGGGGNIVSIARDKLRYARAAYAATKPDNRVGDALSRFGASTYDSGTQPFGTAGNPSINSGGNAHAAASGPKISQGDVISSATQRCSGTDVASAEHQSCMTTQEARAIMNADPEIKAACGLQADTASRDDCALKMYADQAATRQASSGAEKNCYFEQNGKPCYPGGTGAPDKPAKKAEAPNLREQLRARMNAMKKAMGGSTADADAEVAPKTEQENQSAQSGRPESVVPAQPAAPSSTDDAYQNYMNSGNGSSGGFNNGDLGPSR